MARADVKTLLPLDRYAEILQIDPIHFNGVVTEHRPILNANNDLWRQYGWMGSQGRGSRNELASAIQQAEQLMIEKLRYAPAPMYIDGERHPVLHNGLKTIRYAPKGRQRIETEYAHVRYMGKQKMSLIEAGVPIVRSDYTGDGWEDRATITLTDASVGDIESSSEVVIVASGSDATFETEWIKNLRVTLDETTLTAIGNSAWFVDPSLWDRDSVIDGDEEDSFLEEVDIYRVYYVQTGDDPAVLYEYESDDYPTTLPSAAGVGTVHDHQNGFATITPADWDDDTETWNVTTLDAVAVCGGLLAYINLWYVAGIALDRQGRMRNDFARAVAALTTARMTMPITGGGESVDKIFNYWQEIPRGDDRPTYAQKECPFGPQRGAWEAWTFAVQFMRRIEGSSI